VRILDVSSAFLAAALLACSGGGSGPASPPAEVEPNDGPSQATPVSQGAPVGAAIGSPADADYYGFAVPAGGAFVWVRTFDAGGSACTGVDTLAELYSASGALLGSDDDGGPGLCSDLFLWEPEGTYYAAVRHGGVAGDAFPYTFLVTLIPPADEPNDAAGQATPIASGAPVAAVVGSTSDLDWYALSIPAGGGFVRIQTFDATGATCTGIDTFTELRDAAGAVIGSDDDSGPDLCDDLYAWEPAGAYYGVVRHGGGARAAFPYTVVITVTPGPGGPMVESEPNDSIATADAPYTGDVVVSGSMATATDSDYYALTNDSATTVLVTVTTHQGSIGSCLTADTMLFGYDARGTQIVGNDNGGVGRCASVAWQIPAHATHYVAVHALAGAPFSYLLEIDYL
jgi:hypothetical protein